MKCFAFAAMAALSVCACGAHDEDSAPAPAVCGVVTTRSGPVSAAAAEPGAATCSYLGIPYAAPPIGPLRWKPPQAAASWSAPRPSAIGLACAQSKDFPPFSVNPSGEDCLYLNVWTPNPLPQRAPVMVFVHGGAFGWGAGGIPLYDGASLAASTGAIVVTINYRLGPFGFLSLPALRVEDAAHPSAGNYGIEDQIAAFAWVRAGIDAFGGDPQRVTIFGQSAGASSMLMHLVSPKSKGLFDHVIVESAPASSFLGISSSTADAGGAAFAKALGCETAGTQLACLRAKPVADVLEAVPSKVTLKFDTVGEAQRVWWVPVYDGFVLPDDPRKLIAAGSYQKVPTIVGNTKNEATILLASGAPTDDAGYQKMLEGLFPGHGAAIAQHYPIASFGGSYRTASAEAVTDGMFVCAARGVVRALASSSTPVYRYELAHAIDFVIPNLGAFHGSEIPFVFGSKIGANDLDESEQVLSKSIVGYWGAFASAGDPNGAGRLAWPTYGKGEQEMLFDLSPSITTAYKKAACDFWDGLGP
jgi:para-nitrobenzyl esterase